MNKTNINRLKRVMKNYFDNAEMLLDGAQLIIRNMKKS